MKMLCLMIPLLLLTACQAMPGASAPQAKRWSQAEIQAAPDTTPLLTQFGDSVTTNPQLVYYSAAVLADRDSLAALRKRGADINQIEPVMGQTALQELILARNDTAARLLLEAGADPNTTNTLAIAPLYDAISLDDYTGARLLLEYGATTETREPRMGFYPLHVAASNGDSTATAILLQAGARPNVTDYKGVAPLHLAINSGKAETVRMLLSHGADPTQRTAHGRAPLDVARDHQDPVLIEMIEQSLARKP